MDYFLVNVSSALVRVRHLYAKDEAAPMSDPVTFDLAQYLPVSISSMVEQQLTAVQPPSFVDARLKWNAAHEIVMNKSRRKALDSVDGTTVISLNPMQIRTFLITF